MSVMLAVAGCGRDSQPDMPQRQLPETGAAAPPSQARIGVDGLPNFAPLVERYGPAVVNVEVIHQVGDELSGLSEIDPLFEFFRRFGAPPGEGAIPPQRGAGSGFIVSPDGYILSNAHVVAQADEVIVRLTDRREFPAEVVGIDSYTDVALLKIDAKDLPTVEIGDPDQLRPGEWVVAIGSPFGLENSATAGIVSATSRAVGGNSPVPFIQTDVAVNPGNSGGPLFNLQGKVVGVNSMIFSRTGGYMGLSFAIPIDIAAQVRDQLMKTGRVVRGRIGVSVQDVTASLASSFGLERPYGALVSAVEPRSPADRAGLESGDVILSVAGEPIEHSVNVSRAITQMRPGTKTQLEIWRKGRRERVNVTVGEMPSDEPRVAQRAPRESTAEQSKLGLTVRDLTPEEQRLARTEGKLLVQNATGPAARAGLRQGDIILGVADERIDSLDELRAKTRGLKANDSLALLVERNGARLFVPIRVG